VLLFFTPGDVAENLDGKEGRRPIFALEDGRLVAHNQPPAPLLSPWRRWWKDESRAYLWLELHANRARAALLEVARGERGPVDPAAPRVDPRALPGAAVTARLLVEMAQRARAAGAAFSVVYVPADAELGSAPRDPLAEAAHALLVELAAAEALPLVDLTSGLAARSPGRRLRHAADEHPDPRGHRLIAEALLDSDLFDPTRPAGRI
jgi:hypothetical protein